MIIIKNISKSTEIIAIKSLIDSVLHDSFLHKEGSIKSAKIIQLVDRKKEEIDRFSIVRCDSEKTEKYLIAALDGKDIDNRVISVKKYIVRHWTHDRREQRNTAIASPNDERLVDRRRRHLKMIVVCEICEKIRSKTFEFISSTKIWLSSFMR